MGKRREATTFKKTAGMQHLENGQTHVRSRTALLLIDVINHFDFPGGNRLLKAALRIAPPTAQLIARARLAAVPVVYVNDNFGQWRSNFDQLLAKCISPNQPGNLFVRQLAPQSDDYLVLKPKNSAFYLTPLEILLKQFGTSRLIITGLCTDSCILFTAQDAYMRELELLVPSDCVAAQVAADHRAALKQMQAVAKANIAIASQIEF